MAYTRRLGELDISRSNPSVAVPPPGGNGGDGAYDGGGGDTGGGGTNTNTGNQTWTNDYGWQVSGGMTKPDYTSGTKPLITGGAPTGMNSPSYTLPGSINNAGPASFGTRPDVALPANWQSAGFRAGSGNIPNLAEGGGGTPAAPAAFAVPGAYAPVPTAPTSLMTGATTSTGAVDHMANFMNLYKISPQLANEYRLRSGDTIGWWQSQGQNQILNQLFGGDQYAMNSWINGTSPQGSNAAPLGMDWLSQLNNLSGTETPAWALPEGYR